MLAHVQVIRGMPKTVISEQFQVMALLPQQQGQILKSSEQEGQACLIAVIQDCCRTA